MSLRHLGRLALLQPQAPALTSASSAAPHWQRGGQQGTAGNLNGTSPGTGTNTRFGPDAATNELPMLSVRVGDYVIRRNELRLHIGVEPSNRRLVGSALVLRLVVYG